MTTVANLLFPIMDNIVLISHTHREDPAWGDLKAKIEQRQLQRGEHPDTHPYVFQNLTQLPAIIQLQRERIMEDKQNDAPHVRQLLLILNDMFGEVLSPLWEGEGDIRWHMRRKCLQICMICNGAIPRSR